MPPSRTVARRRSRVTLIVLLAVLAALALFAVVARAAAAADSDAAAAAAVGLEDDGDYDDDDDVEEADKKPWTPPPSAPATSNTMRSLTLADITFQEFRYDLLAVSVILVYLAVHLYSRRSNLNVATSWLQRVMPVLNANFAHVGDEKKFNLIRDGPQDYIFFATGRRFVQTMYGYIKLFLPPSTPAALAISYTNSTPTYDRVVVDMQLDPKLDGLVFAIMDKKKASKITKGRYDLTDFSIPTKANRRLPRHYVLTTDCPEFATAVLEDDEFVAALWESVGLAEGDEARGFKEPLFESNHFQPISR
ncbi:hypothetical protein DFJ73DRAFT_797812 [Zopfochytrium polystomum]|nr:hypothetical protein DFJ73DRAFT_797812 [Zopfochytrium polystomum]